MDENDFSEEDYAFESHDDVVAVVHMMEEKAADTVPRVLWVVQREQMRSAVRNHFESLGYSVHNEDLMRGALYGTVLAINLESQSAVISLQTIMLATVLLDMLEHPSDIGFENLAHLREMLADTRKRQRPSKIRMILRRVTGALSGR